MLNKNLFIIQFSIAKHLTIFRQKVAILNRALHAEGQVPLAGYSLVFIYKSILSEEKKEPVNVDCIHRLFGSRDTDFLLQLNEVSERSFSGWSDTVFTTNRTINEPLLF